MREDGDLAGPHGARRVVGAGRAQDGRLPGHDAQFAAGHQDQPYGVGADGIGRGVEEAGLGEGAVPDAEVVECGPSTSPAHSHMPSRARVQRRSARCTSRALTVSRSGP
ncbi:hypothetical protein O1M54_10840 [Streptomyces diastatochromogenes]|nr:hypothetical protein [Streptomyces diastatochromogenes]